MKTFACILLLSIYSVLSFGQDSSNGKAGKADAQSFHPAPDMAMDATFPLHLNDIDFKDRSKYVTLDDQAIIRIEMTIQEYYVRECNGDSLQSATAFPDLYFNSLRFQDSLHTIYLLLLKHPSGLLNGKVLFYDKALKSFSMKTFDFNLFALYDFKDGRLEPSILKKKLHITGPEIDLLDYDHDGVIDYKFTRLVHNGTYNAIQTTILTLHQLRLDTLSLLESKL